MYGYAIQQGLLRNDYQNLQKYMNIAFIGRYLPKMLERPLYKGLEAREVCAKHLPYTSHIPPVTPPVSLGSYVSLLASLHK